MKDSGMALVDGHIHLHSCYDIDAALDSAADNFESVRTSQRLPAEVPGVLWLVEHRDEGSTERLRAFSESGGRWQVDACEDVVLKLRHVDRGHRLTIVFGRQIRTVEDLEVLVVGTTETSSSDRPLEETVEAWLDQEVLVMLPWGFGKWTGARGRTVAKAYEKYSARGLRLADTGAHSRLRSNPGSFIRSIADGMPVLSGSDPFPFPDQVGAVGRSGFVLENIRADFGWSDLRHTVTSLNQQPLRFGRPLRIAEFVRLQGKMQMRKRFGTGGSA